MITAMPRFAVERVAQRREEKQGYLSIVSAVMPEQGVFMVNRSAGKIIDMCDGKTSLSQLCARFAASFHGTVELERASTDVMKVLERLDKLGLIDWTTGVNPFREQRDEDNWCGPSGVVYQAAMEQDLDRVVQLLRPLHSDEGSERLLYVPVSIVPGQYREAAVRRRMFEYLEVFLIGSADDDVVVCSMSCPQPNSRIRCGLLGPIVVSGEVKDPERIVNEVIGFGCHVVNKFALEESVKIRAIVDAGSDKREETVRLLSSAGFRHQATLADELGRGVDMELWDRWIDVGFNPSSTSDRQGVCGNEV